MPGTTGLDVCHPFGGVLDLARLAKWSSQPQSTTRAQEDTMTLTPGTHRLAGHTPATPLQRAAAECAAEGYQRHAGRLPVETRRKPRAPRGKSATDQAEALAGLLVEKAAKIQETAIAEVRFYLGEMLRELATAPAAEVASVQLAGEEHEVSDDYRAGLLLAASLVADPDVDY